MELNLIVAHDINNTIGNSKTNDLPWYLPEDLKKFRLITSNYPMIMGKNTFLSLPRILPGRKHIVVTARGNELDIPFDIFEGPETESQVLAFSNLTKAIIFCENWLKAEKTFVIGGGKMYESVLKNHKISKIYRTLIEKEFKGDIKFPELKKDQWQIITDDPFEKDNFTFRFQVLKEQNINL